MKPTVSSSAPTLAYEPPDPKMIRSRRGSKVALLVAIASLLLVAYLFSAKLATPIKDHVATLAAQREVLSLPSPSTTLDRGTTRETSADAPSLSASRLRAAASRWRGSRASTQGGEVYVGAMQNAAGKERIVCLEIWPDVSVNVGTRGIAYALVVRERVPTWRFERPLKNGVQSLGHLLPAAKALHVDAPTLDPTNPGRLLVAGQADGRRFSFELTLDASDRAECFDLLVAGSATRPTE